MQTSCIFWYQKRVFKAKGELLRDAKGEPVVNDNYISFLQVISAYWETVDISTGKRQLNVFLNGGSVSRDRETGDVQMKAGYTLQLPEFLGVQFLEQFWNWASVFGLGSSNGETTAPRTRTRENGAEHRGRSQVREDEFVDIAATANQPAAEFETSN